MSLQKLSKIFNTVRHLKYKQVHYQVYYRIRKKISRGDFYRKLEGGTFHVQLSEGIASPVSFSPPSGFRFLNLAHTFDGKIDWNFSAFGKLWIYNLNYFDFLGQEDLDSHQGLALIREYVAEDAALNDGKEPYPVSLRGINWIKFLSKHHISDESIDQALFNHYQVLLHNIEYHLLGNHLLENGFSLLFGAYYFRDEQLLRQAQQILASELPEQVLEDGAHFELAPMYHQIILHRLLDCFNLQRNNAWEADQTRKIVAENCTRMLGWLSAIVYRNGDIPMLNDSAPGIAPGTHELMTYAKRLGIGWQPAALKDSGYRKWSDERFEMIMDVGHIGPDYIPGHAHSDTFSFELRVNEHPFITDQGISTYEKNARRQEERSTVAHNTVMVNNADQSEVWGGFRVARRARITELEETAAKITAAHNGYRNQGITHRRTFERMGKDIVITDTVVHPGKSPASKAFIHFHPSVQGFALKGDELSFEEISSSILFTGAMSIRLFSYEFCEGYNKTVTATAAEITFSDHLSTLIRL